MKSPLPQEEQKIESSPGARVAEGAKTDSIAPAAPSKILEGMADVKSERKARKGHSFVVGPAS